MAARRVADPLAHLVADPDGHEALDDAAVVNDPERGVAGSHEVADAVHDQLQHLVDLEHPGDATDRDVERGEALGRQADLGPRPDGVEREPQDPDGGLAGPDGCVEPQRPELGPTVGGSQGVAACRVEDRRRGAVRETPGAERDRTE